jgi:hypothetical protein
MGTNWSRGGRNWSALPKKNPGPGRYEHNPPARRVFLNKENGGVPYFFPGNKFGGASLEDPAIAKRIKNNFPGPASYPLKGLNV